MTGFGSGTFSDGKLSVTIEIKAVNQRFLELNIRMPRAYMALEDRLRNAVKKTIHRGKVDMFVTVTELERQPQKSVLIMRPLKLAKLPSIRPSNDFSMMSRLRSAKLSPFAATGSRRNLPSSTRKRSGPFLTTPLHKPLTRLPP